MSKLVQAGQGLSTSGKQLKECEYWETIGENTCGFIERCCRCGAIRQEGKKADIFKGPATAVDLSTLYCPEQGYL